MNAGDIATRLRATFDVPPTAGISDSVALLSALVREQTQESRTSPEFSSFLVALEEQLLEIYGNNVNHSSVTHLEAFISVLCTLRPVLPASSIITWFDHLRPALREPLLASEVKTNLQILLASALDNSKHATESRSREFRRRIADLYILDASGATSAEDAIEEQNQRPSEREARRVWKENIESILQIDLLTSPTESLALLNVLFSEPSSRYSILALIIRVLSSRGALPPIVALSRSPFLKSLTDSILAEHSPHLFHREIAALVLASPYFAVYAPDSLVEMLPDLLAILGRTLSRRTDLRVGSDTEEDNRSPEAERSTSTSGDMRPDPRNPDSSQPRERFRARSRGTLPLGNGSDSAARLPSSDGTLDAPLFFTFIYGLFPCNTIAFLRRPTAHLEELGFFSSANSRVLPSDFLNESEIRFQSSILLRTHVIHPDILLRDAKSERTSPRTWTSEGANLIDEVARLVSQCVALDNTYASSENRTGRVMGRTSLKTDDIRSPRKIRDLSSSLSSDIKKGSVDVPWDLIPASDLEGAASSLQSRSAGQISHDFDQGSFENTPRARRRDPLLAMSPPQSKSLMSDEDDDDDDVLQVLSSSQGTSHARTAVYYHESPVEQHQQQPSIDDFHHPLLFTSNPPTSSSLSQPSVASVSAPLPTLLQRSRESSAERTIQGVQELNLHPSTSRHHKTNRSHSSHHARATSQSHSHSHSPSPLAHPSPLSLSTTIPLPDDDEDEIEPEPDSSLSQSASPTQFSHGGSQNPTPAMLSDALGALTPESSGIPPSTTASTSSPFHEDRVPASSHPTGSTLFDLATGTSTTYTDMTSLPAAAIPFGKSNGNGDYLLAFEAIQQENARLRDLNALILWMRDEMRHHVERLHRQRVMFHGEELERQSLHNRLREYKSRLVAVQSTNKRLKEQADLTKKNSKQWSDELQSKLRDFRKEKRNWMEEAVALRGKVHDAEARMKAQQNLMEATERQRSALSIKMEYYAPKIEHLEKLEAQLERLRKYSTIDESETVKALRADSEALKVALEKIEKQLLLIASLEHANEELQQLLKERNSDNLKLDSRIASLTQKSLRGRSPQQRYRPLSQSFSTAFRSPPLNATSPPSPDEAYKKLQAENLDLKEEIEELQMMVEQLRNDGERARIHARRKSIPVPVLHSPTPTVKASPLPAVLSPFFDHEH